MRCQWPMVTPVSLNGAGCAAAPVVTKADANKNATKRLVFTVFLPVEPVEIVLATLDGPQGQNTSALDPRPIEGRRGMRLRYSRPLRTAKNQKSRRTGRHPLVSTPVLLQYLKRRPLHPPKTGGRRFGVP